MTKNCAYVRVSTLKESQKDSPEHQESVIREHAAREGTNIEKVYQDRDTATNIVGRKDVQQMIEDAKRGEVKSIWFVSLSRFARDTLDALSLKRILVNALGIRVVSIEDGYDSAVKDDELLFGIRSVVNQNASIDISVSSRRGIEKSAAKGNYIGTRAPYGYKKVEKDGRKTLEIVPEQAEVVKMIFNLYNEGLGVKAITRYLNGENEQGIMYPAAKGGLWGLTSVNGILKNENYTGYNVYGKTSNIIVYDDLNDLMNRKRKQVRNAASKYKKTEFQTHEAIISKEEFEKAKEMRQLRGDGKQGGARRFINVFAKLIFCKECGAAMVTMRTNKRKIYRYLMCSRRRRIGVAGCINGKWWHYESIRDDLITEILVRIKRKILRLEREGLKQLETHGSIYDYTKEIKKLERTIKDNRRLLFELRKQYMLGEMKQDQYEFEKDMYDTEIDECQKRLNEIQVKKRRVVDTERLINDARQSLISLTELKNYEDTDKTRMLLMKIVKRIDVTKDGEIVIQTYL